MPRILRAVIANMLAGFGIAALALAGLLLADPGGAAGLLLRAAGHWWPAALLWLFLGLTFGAVQFGVAVQLGSDAPQPPRRGRPGPTRLAGLSPACAPASTRCARDRWR
jgi:hypothetical protein